MVSHIVFNCLQRTSYQRKKRNCYLECCAKTTRLPEKPSLQVNHEKIISAERTESYFTTLPREIRDQIFSYLIPFESTSSITAEADFEYSDHTDDNWTYPIVPGLGRVRSSFFFVSKQFYQDCRDAYFRKIGIRCTMNVRHSSDNPWSRSNPSIIYWKLPFIKYIRQLNITINWRCEPNKDTASATRDLLEAIEATITPIITLADISISILVPATNLEVWPMTPPSHRIDLEKLFYFHPQCPDLRSFRMAVRGYHELFGQDIDHPVYERKEAMPSGTTSRFVEETGDWKGHRLYPGVWREIWDVGNLVKERRLDTKQRGLETVSEG